MKIMPASRTPSNKLYTSTNFLRFSDTTGGERLAVRNNNIMFNKDLIVTLEFVTFMRGVRIAWDREEMSTSYWS
jgi:hypothetical protein